MLTATSKTLLLGLFVAQFFVIGALARTDDDVDADDVAALESTLLGIFQRANRMTSDDEESAKLQAELEQDPDFKHCESLLENIEEDFIESCLRDCMVDAKLGLPFDLEKHEECAPDETAPAVSQTERGKRKWFKKVGAWFKRNKDKIINGLKTAVKIIGGIIAAIGKKK